MKKLLLGLALATVAGVSFAKDYGVQGNQWPVTEVDMRMLLVSEAAEKDWNAVNDRLKASAKGYVDNRPKRNLPTVDRTQTVWFDPSIELTSDIQAPLKQADGSYSWTVLYPKGTRVNPLQSQRPLTALLFVDSSQEAQVKFAEDILAKEPNRIQIIEAGAGSILAFNAKLKRPVFYADDALMTRFQVKYLPTLVYPGDGAHELFLGVTSFGMPFDAKQAMQAWEATRPAVVPTSSGKPK